MAGPLRDLHFALSTVPMIHRLGALWNLLNMAREDPYHKHEIIIVLEIINVSCFGTSANLSPFKLSTRPSI